MHRKNIQTEVEEAGQQRSNLPNCEAVLQRQQQPTENDMSSYMMRNLGIILHYQILQFHQTNLRFPPPFFALFIFFECLIENEAQHCNFLSLSKFK